MGGFGTTVDGTAGGIGACRTYASRLNFHPLDIGHAGHTSFASAALRGGFSSLSLGALFGRRVLTTRLPPYRVAKILTQLKLA